MDNLKSQTYVLIDQLKATCQQAGLGNDGNEFKIITQVFLYKFLNDKFLHACKALKVPVATKLREGNEKDWEKNYSELSEDERKMLFLSLPTDVAKLEPNHLISFLWNQQNREDFDTLFDATMDDIGKINSELFSTQTAENTQVPLFEPLMPFVTDASKRADFARALIDKLVNFSFEDAFGQSYDFFAAVFEYLIKDYNIAGGGKYAEYYTPHSISTIMARLLVPSNEGLHGVECYDPSAGTGTLLMAVAHQIGEDKCTIYSQDISQKSNKLLKLNLLLNSLVESLDNIIQGDTLTSPYHMENDGKSLKKFDFVVSNPPFNMDFSDSRDIIASFESRFWAGVPNIPKKKKEGMAIYTCFLQHVINSLKDTGKGAIVVPTGFITAKTSIEKNILKKIVDEEIISGVISMPSNVFATTGTNVSVLIFDKAKQHKNVVLIDASKLGEEYKEGKNKKVRLRTAEIEKIVQTFQRREAIDDFSAVVSYDGLKEKDYSLSAGMYFELKIPTIKKSPEEFKLDVIKRGEKIKELFKDSRNLEKEIFSQLEKLGFSKSRGDNSIQ